MESGTSRATQGTCAKAEALPLGQELELRQRARAWLFEKDACIHHGLCRNSHAMLVRMLAKASPAAAV